MRRVRFVADAASIPASEPGTTVVVLDVAWTPGTGPRPDVIPIRPVFGAVTARHDLFDTALRLVDDWADEGGMADRLIVGDVTYWFRIRETMWRWLHERLLWRYALAELGVVDGTTELVIEADEAGLRDVAAAAGALPAPPADGPPSPDPGTPQAPTADAPVTARSRSQVRPSSRLAMAARRLLRSAAGPSAPTTRPRQSEPDPDFLADRYVAMTSDQAPRVVVLTTPITYQRLTASAVPRDPILGAVVDALEGQGIRVTLVAIGLDHRQDDDVETLRADERMLPLTWIRKRWGSANDAVSADAATAAIAAALSAAVPPLVIDGLDLTPSFTGALSEHLARIVATDVRHRAMIDRFLAGLRPDAILLAQEGIRVPWLAAAHDRGVSTFAVQHGILYLGHPGYPHRRHSAVRRPTTTFVFGSYERDVLLRRGAYLPAEVVVGGSPRLDLDIVGDVASDDERGAIRAELGVETADRLLVVSTVNVPLLQRAHLAPMIERLLGGPLPGVHVCFKLHPGERDDGPYRALLEGLAAAGGYEAPPISVRRDIDLLGLLRASDAHLGLHSTVLTDAVSAGTMNLIAMTDAHADLLGYVDAGVASPVRSGEDVLEALASRRPASAEARQAFLERHFEPGRAGPRIARVIVETIGRPTDRMVGATRG